MSSDICLTTSLENIVDMKRTSAKILNEKRHATTPSGKQHQLRITNGWKFLVEFKDGSKA